MKLHHALRRGVDEFAFICAERQKTTNISNAAAAASNQQYSYVLITYLNVESTPSLAKVIDEYCLTGCGYRAHEVFFKGCFYPHQAQRHANWLLASQQAGCQAMQALII